MPTYKDEQGTYTVAALPLDFYQPISNQTPQNVSVPGIPSYTDVFATGQPWPYTIRNLNWKRLATATVTAPGTDHHDECDNESCGGCGPKAAPRSWRISWTPPVASDDAVGGAPWYPRYAPEDPDGGLTPGTPSGLLLRITWGLHGVQQLAYVDYGYGGSLVVHSQDVTVEVMAALDNSWFPAGFLPGLHLVVGATITPCSNSQSSEFSPTMTLNTGTIDAGGIDGGGQGSGWVIFDIPPYAKAFRWWQYLNTGAAPTPPARIAFTQVDDPNLVRVRHTDGTGQRFSNGNVSQVADSPAVGQFTLRAWPEDGWLPIAGTTKLLVVENDEQSEIGASIAMWVQFRLDLG